MAKFKKGDHVSYITNDGSSREGTIIDIDRIKYCRTSKEETILYGIKDSVTKNIVTKTYTSIKLLDRSRKGNTPPVRGKEPEEKQFVFTTALESAPEYKITIVALVKPSIISGYSIHIGYSICSPLDEFKEEVGIKNARKMIEWLWKSADDTVNNQSLYFFMDPYRKSMVKPILYAAYTAINEDIARGKKVYFCGKKQVLPSPITEILNM